MNNSVKDLRVILRFKNALLLDAIERKFGDVSIKELATIIGMSYNTIISLINLRQSPFALRHTKYRGKESFSVDGYIYTPSSIKLAGILDCLVEDLFPLTLYKLDLPDKVQKDFPSVQMLSLQEARKQKLLTMENYEEDFDKPFLQDDINFLLSTLTPREERVIKMRFGLDGEDEHTLDETAAQLGISKERIRQIERRGLLKLRHPARKSFLKEYY